MFAFKAWLTIDLYYLKMLLYVFLFYVSSTDVYFRMGNEKNVINRL